MSWSLRICSFLLLVTLAEAFLFGSLMMSSVKGTGTTNGYSSPKFKVLKRTESYVLREYEPSNWVATSAKGSTSSLFMRLFRYISGDNESKSKIPMTVPVSIKISPGEGNPQNFTMQFYLPEATNPKPTNQDVFLTSYPALKLYVRTYGGYTSDEKLQSNLEQLKKDIGVGNYDPSYYFSAGYDPPWKFWNRINEVWVLAK